MLHCKDIKKIDELKSTFNHRWLEVDYLLKIIDIFKISSLLKKLTHFKKQGFKFDYVLSILLTLPFIQVSNINQITMTNIKAKKDVFYRLKNNSLIDWRFILELFVVKFINIIKVHAGSNDKIKCLVIDDSFIEKSGKYIEKISRVWDHVSKRYLLGFKLNLMGYWDGFSFIPINFSLHREIGKNKKNPFGLKNKELRKQYNKKCSKDTPLFERKKKLIKQRLIQE